jgi:hypothetical protein
MFLFLSALIGYSYFDRHRPISNGLSLREFVEQKILRIQLLRCVLVVPAISYLMISQENEFLRKAAVIGFIVYYLMVLWWTESEIPCPFCGESFLPNLDRVKSGRVLRLPQSMSCCPACKTSMEEIVVLPEK